MMNRRSVLLALSAGAATSVVGVPALAASGPTLRGTDPLKVTFRIPVPRGERFLYVETETGPNRVSISHEAPVLDRCKAMESEVGHAYSQVKNPFCKVRVRDRLGRPWMGAGEETFFVVGGTGRYRREGGLHGVAASAVISSTTFWVNSMFHRSAYARTDWVHDAAYDRLSQKAYQTAFWNMGGGDEQEDEEIGSYILEIASDSEDVLALQEESNRIWFEINTFPRSEAEENALHEELCSVHRLIYKKRHGLV